MRVPHFGVHQVILVVVLPEGLSDIVDAMCLGEWKVLFPALVQWRDLRGGEQLNLDGWALRGSDWVWCPRCATRVPLGATAHTHALPAAAPTLVAFGTERQCAELQTIQSRTLGQTLRSHPDTD